MRTSGHGSATMQQVPAGVAQLAERPSCKRQASGSIPLTGSIHPGQGYVDLEEGQPWDQSGPNGAAERRRSRPCGYNAPGPALGRASCPQLPAGRGGPQHQTSRRGQPAIVDGCATGRGIRPFSASPVTGLLGLAAARYARPRDHAPGPAIWQADEGQGGQRMTTPLDRADRGGSKEGPEAATGRSAGNQWHYRQARPLASGDTAA